MSYDDISENDINDSEVFNGMKESSEIMSLNEILISLISDKKNLTLKTEIQNPKALASLYVYMEYFKSKNYIVSANIIEGLIDIYLEYMVSNKRRSRKEIIKAISSWIEIEQTKNTNRLMINQEV